MDRQIVSLSSLHLLSALFLIFLLFHITNAPSDIAQSTFAGHLIAHPDQVYPTGQKDWNKTLVREMLLKNLTALENLLDNEGFNVHDFNHGMNVGSHNDAKYQDSLIVHLRTQGFVPPHKGFGRGSRIGAW